MSKILCILPKSIGGRLTTSSIIDGFLGNSFEVNVYDELKSDSFLKDDYKYIVGYDFSPIKFKVDNHLEIPVISYFSDVIENKTSGEGYLEYNKYLNSDDTYVFYWDRELSKNKKYIYQPHFVNTEIYKNYKTPIFDVLFMGRLDTDLRLKMYLELNKKLKEYTFKWYAIEKHFLDALSRCENIEEKNILKNTYSGFIDNEEDMSRVINEAKIVYNINAQGKTSLNYRSIQTLACERLLISDDRKELDLFQNIIPVYSNIDDLVEKIRFYLSDDFEYKKIVKKSREIIEKNHDSIKCVKNMLDKIN